MGSFNASLRTFGDHEGLPATVQLDSGRLSIALGDQPLGDWALDEIHLEPIESGYRLEAEGDQVLLDHGQHQGLRSRAESESAAAGTEAIPSKPSYVPPSQGATQKPPKGSPRAQNGRTQRPANEPKPTKEPPGPSKSGQEPAKEPKAAKPAKEAKAAGEPDPGPNVLVARLDGVLNRAEKRWGALLPTWVFTRAVALGVVAVLVVVLLLPSLFSTILLIVGLGVIVFGAVFYMDPILMAKWLPGRMQPAHVLIVGVASVLFGVLLGLIAK